MLAWLREGLARLITHGREPKVRRIARDVSLTPLVDPALARTRTVVPFADPDTGTQLDLINHPDPPQNCRG